MRQLRLKRRICFYLGGSCSRAAAIARSALLPMQRRVSCRSRNRLVRAMAQSGCRHLPLADRTATARSCNVRFPATDIVPPGTRGFSCTSRHINSMDAPKHVRIKTISSCAVPIRQFYFPPLRDPSNSYPFVPRFPSSNGGKTMCVRSATIPEPVPLGTLSTLTDQLVALSDARPTDRISVTGHNTLDIFLDLCRRGFCHADCRTGAQGPRTSETSADSLWIVEAEDAAELRTLIS